MAAYIRHDGGVPAKFAAVSIVARPAAAPSELATGEGNKSNGSSRATLFGM
jgi:hypothetical protein